MTNVHAINWLKRGLKGLTKLLRPMFAILAAHLVITAVAAVIMLTGVGYVAYRLPFWLLESDLKQRINERWPPRSDDVQTRRSVLTSRAALNAISTVDVALILPKWTLNTILSDVIKDRSSQITRSEITTRDQQVSAEVDFDIPYLKGRVHIYGTAYVNAAPIVAGDTLRLEPTLSRVHVRRASIKEKIDVTVSVAFLNPILERLLENLSGTLETVETKLPFGYLKTLTPRDVLGVEGFTNLSGPTINLRASVGNISVLVDRRGIWAIGEIVPLSPDRFKKVIQQLTNSPPTASTRLSSEQIAVLSQCLLQPEIHSEAEKTDVESFSKFCDTTLASRRQRRHQSTIGPSPPASSAEAYAAFAKEFESKLTYLVSKEDQLSVRPRVAVSKESIAKVVNEMAAEPHFRGDYEPGQIVVREKMEVRSEESPNLNCDQIGCNPNFGECVPTWNCEGRGCPSDCAWHDLGCHAWKPICEGLKAAEKGACEVDKGRFQLMCNAKKEGEKLECELRKAGCFANQRWLDTWAEKELGETSFDGSVERLTATFEVTKFSIAKDLSTITVDGQIGARGAVTGTATFIPKALGNLACLSQWRGPVNAEVKIETFTDRRTATLVQQVHEGQTLRLAYENEPVPVKLKFTPPPLQAALDNNPGLYVLCTGGVIGKMFGAGSRDTYDYNLPKKRASIPIDASTFILLGNTFSLTPEWHDASIHLFPKSPRWKLWPGD